MSAMVRKHFGIIVLFGIALLLRIGIMFWATGFREHPDMLRWKDWGRISYLYGYADTYTPKHITFGTYPNNMPPGTLYVVSGMYKSWLSIGKVLSRFGIQPGSNVWVNVILLQLMLKLPSLAADLGIGILIYSCIRMLGKGEKAARLGSACFLFNPVVLWNSSFWGQMDSITNLFALLALWFVIQQRYLEGSFAFMISLLIKFSLIFTAPFFILVSLWKNPRWKRTLIDIIVLPLAAIVLFVAPISKDMFSWYADFAFGNAVGEMTNITAFAFNLWWVIYQPTLLFDTSGDLTKVVDIHLTNAPLTETMMGPVSLFVVALGVSLAVQIAMYIRFVKEEWLNKSMTNTRIIGYFATLAIIAYLTLPHMHERYLYPAFAPLAILIGIGRPIGKEFIVLSLLNFINLVAVWHPIPLPMWIFSFLVQTSFQWIMAVLTVWVGIVSARKILRYETIHR